MRLCLWWSNTISHHLVEFGSHEPCRNRDITFFIRHVSVVSWDYCGWWNLLIGHHHFKFSRIWSHGRWNITFLLVPWLRVITWTKEYVTLKLWLLIISHSSCLVWLPLDSSKWRYNVFLFVMWPNLSTWSTGYGAFLITSFYQKLPPCQVY